MLALKQSHSISKCPIPPQNNLTGHPYCPSLTSAPCPPAEPKPILPQLPSVKSSSDAQTSARALDFLSTQKGSLGVKRLERGSAPLQPCILSPGTRTCAAWKTHQHTVCLTPPLLSPLPQMLSSFRDEPLHCCAHGSLLIQVP